MAEEFHYLSALGGTGCKIIQLQAGPRGYVDHRNSRERRGWVAIDIPPGTLANEYLFSITTEVVAIMSGSRTEIPATLFRPPTLTIQVTVT